MDARTIVDEIRQRTPCPITWDSMTGDDRVRFCSACSQSVYNVAALTTEEVAELISQREGRLCLRLYRLPNGTVVTADCPAVADTPPPRRRSPLRRVHALVIVLLALMLTWARRDTSPPPPSGAGVAWEDWVQWAAVSLGIRPIPTSAPVFTPPGQVITGDSY